jgi:hypothetical protein
MGEISNYTSKNIRTYLPRYHKYNDEFIEIVHNFLWDLVDNNIQDSNLYCKKTDTIENLFLNLNKRISECKNIKKDALELSKNLTNNYIISSVIPHYLGEGVGVPFSEVGGDLDKNLKESLPIQKTCPAILGYIYKIVLDIRDESCFHVYFKPIIYTYTNSVKVTIKEEEILVIHFEDLLKYRIITKEDYEKRLTELITNNET